MSDTTPHNDDAARARVETKHAAAEVAHSDHDGHDAVVAEEPEEAPRQIPLALYIAPIIIFIIVLIFIWRPVTSAFSRYQTPPAQTENSGAVSSGAEASAGAAKA